LPALAAGAAASHPQFLVNIAKRRPAQSPTLSASLTIKTV
jgi:hypothetical protein